MIKITTVIKTIIDKFTGNMICPRTISKAVTMDDGTVLDDRLTELDNLVSTKAPLSSPNFSGTPTVSANMVYHTGNMTLTTITPSTALADGVQVQVY